MIRKVIDEEEYKKKEMKLENIFQTNDKFTVQKYEERKKII